MAVNEEIRSPKVRLIDQQGKQVGVISRDEALEIARREGLDLVEVAPQANPPVCRLLDYGNRWKKSVKKTEKNSPLIV